MGEELAVLKEISRKLDKLIALWKVSNREVIRKVAEEISRDKIAAKILEITKEEPQTYSNIARRVSVELGVAEITVKLKISKLKGFGFLIARREGRIVYYENPGFLE